MTQWLIVATIGGDAADVIEALFQSWRDPSAPDPAAVDQFCERLRANGAELPVLHYCEWVDRWLSGDLVSGPGEVIGRWFQATCLSAQQAVAWAERCGNQFQEQEWLASRLREAAASWELMTDRRVVVVIRKVIGGSTTDEEVNASLRHIPEWLNGYLR